jgi:DNA-binding SARP family transcriptional activator
MHFAYRRTTAMSKLRITLFGKFSVWQANQKLDIIEARKLQEMLSYLLLFRDHSHPRESLAELFWGDNSSTQSKKYLRQALWQLQSIFNPFFERETKPLLITEFDWIRIDSKADLWLDVAEFEQAYALVKGKLGRQFNPQDFEILENAVGLYQGDLLEGCYQDWCLFERERLQNTYLEMLDKLMDYCEDHREYENGLVYGTLILRLDRARERTHRRLMRLYHLEGNRTEALRQYERCKVALQEELGVAPSNRTKELLEQIRMDCLEKSVLFQATKNQTSYVQALILSEILSHLNQLVGMHADFQRKAQKEIQMLEQILKDMH